MPKKTKDTGLEIIEQLRKNLDSLRREATAAGLPTSRRNRLNQEIQKIGLEIEVLLREINPIKLPPAMFDPSNPDLVGRFIALALVAQPRVTLTVTIQTSSETPSIGNTQRAAPRSSA